MFVNTTGIVLREVTYKDSSKILTVLTADEGKVTVSAHGAYRKNSKLAASTGLLVFSHMTISQRKDRWTLTEAQPIEQFLGLRDDLKLLSLGSYIAELTEAISDEDSLNTQLLPLCLNTLYALSEKLKTPEQIKLAFELRLMTISGFEPVLEELKDLREVTGEEGTLKLTAAALGVARYIISCDAKKLFSFKIDEKTQKELSVTAEHYLLTHLDRAFKTLDYYKRL
ncbi:MAG: DNA repair protein RecO [Oscillospiraceae bacterium]|nr:DNA repair protein RecO [Oscillospiraceae bacterium]